MSKIERSYENCEIYCDLQEHGENLRDLFIWLQGRPLESYENWKSYKIHEGFEIYCNSRGHGQNLQNLFIGLQGRTLQS